VEFWLVKLHFDLPVKGLNLEKINDKNKPWLNTLYINIDFLFRLLNQLSINILVSRFQNSGIWTLKTYLRKTTFHSLKLTLSLHVSKWILLNLQPKHSQKHDSHAEVLGSLTMLVSVIDSMIIMFKRLGRETTMFWYNKHLNFYLRWLNKSSKEKIWKHTLVTIG